MMAPGKLCKAPRHVSPHVLPFWQCTDAPAQAQLTQPWSQQGNASKILQYMGFLVMHELGYTLPLLLWHIQAPPIDSVRCQD